MKPATQFGRCRICHRPLSNPESAKLGVGPICASKQVQRELFENATPLLLDVGALADVGLVCRRMADGQLAANLAQRVVWHSPTGFECGYGGSGPADLALNVLNELVPPRSDGCEPEPCFRGECSRTAARLHQDFKRAFIACMDSEGGTVPIETIRTWLEQQQHEVTL